MKPTNIKKLIAFFTAITGIFSSFALHAQIVYTDIKDVTFTCNKKCSNCFHYTCSKTCPLDLNNDGSPDFNITAIRAVSHADGCQAVYCCVDDILNHVSITALNGNSVIVGPSGTALISGSDISSFSQVLGNFSLKWVSDHGYSCQILTEGDWPNSSDRYLGLGIISNGQTYYGWGRLSVFVDINEASFKIKDYAYESTPGKAIHAGDTKASLANSSVSNASKKDATSLNLKIVPNPVSSSAIFSFSLPAAGQVSIRLYDKTGTLVMNVTDREFTKGIQQIKVDTKDLNAGVYLLQLKTPAFVKTEKLIVTK